MLGRLLELQRIKRSSVILSVDLYNKQDILNVIDTVGEYIVGIKLHNDTIHNFDELFINDILQLKNKHNFIIIEDRKFCDIGHIVQVQSKNIMRYADIVTVHSIAGQSTIGGLRKNACLYDTSLLLIAQMSSNNNLIDQEYTKKTIELANNNADIVLGFICQEKLSNNFLHFAPGISNVLDKDTMNQHYTNATDALNKGIQFIIVGRSIYTSTDPITSVKSYIPKYVLLKKLMDIGVFKKDDCVLKSGTHTNIYADFRIVGSYPKLLKELSCMLADLVLDYYSCRYLPKDFSYHRILTSLAEYVICAVPLGAILYSLLISQHLSAPHIMLRDKRKEYGTKQLIEGQTDCKNVVLIEDVVTSGSSVQNAIRVLEEEGMVVKQIVVILDRESGGVDKLRAEGYNIVSLFKISDLV